jgi:hypothetical protein
MSVAHDMSFLGDLYLFTECSDLHSSHWNVKITLGTKDIFSFAVVSLTQPAPCITLLKCNEGF